MRWGIGAMCSFLSAMSLVPNSFSLKTDVQVSVMCGGMLEEKQETADRPAKLSSWVSTCKVKCVGPYGGRVREADRSPRDHPSQIVELATAVLSRLVDRCLARDVINQITLAPSLHV